MINHIGDTIIVQHNWKYLQIFWIMKYIINTYAVANNWSRQWRGNLSLRVKITWKSKSLYFHWNFTTWCNATKTFEFFKTYTNPWKYHQNHLKSIPLLYTLWKCHQNHLKSIFLFTTPMVTLWKCYEFSYQCSYVWLPCVFR